MESVGIRNPDGGLTARNPDEVSEISVPPQDEADDFAVMVLAVDGRLEVEGALSDREDELEALERRKGALTDLRAEETEWWMPPRDALEDLV